MLYDCLIKYFLHFKLNEIIHSWLNVETFLASFVWFQSKGSQALYCTCKIFQVESNLLYWLFMIRCIKEWNKHFKALCKHNSTVALPKCTLTRFLYLFLLCSSVKCCNSGLAQDNSMKWGMKSWLCHVRKGILFNVLLKCQICLWHNFQTNLILLIALKSLQDSPWCWQPKLSFPPFLFY